MSELTGPAHHSQAQTAGAPDGDRPMDGSPRGGEHPTADPERSNLGGSRGELGSPISNAARQGGSAERSPESASQAGERLRGDPERTSIEPQRQPERQQADTGNKTESQSVFSDGTSREAGTDGTIRLEHPDGRATQERDPDGANRFNGSGVTVTAIPNGPIVVSGDASVRTTPDGDVTATTKDGTTITASPQADMWVDSPDGASRGIGRDGTTSVTSRDGWSVVTSPDGTKTTVTVQRPDGTTLGRDSDGTTSIAWPDGAQTTIRPEKTTIHTTPDGTTYIREPEGTISVTTTDGMTYAREPDGTTSVTGPDGTSTVRQPDGDVYIHYPNGTMYGPVINEPGLEPELDPIEGMKSFVTGAVETVVDTGGFFLSRSPMRAAFDLEGFLNAYDNLLSGAWYSINNPREFVNAVLDVETWKEDPMRALGHLAPGAIVTVATAEAGVMTKIDDAAEAAGKVGAAASKVDDPAAAAGKVDDAAAAGKADEGAAAGKADEGAAAGSEAGKHADAIKQIDERVAAAEAAGKGSAPEQLKGQHKVGPSYATREEAVANLPHAGAHMAHVSHMDANGNIIRTWWEVSELGLGNAGHTEQKALVRVNLKPDETLEINGYHAPCGYLTGCHNVMEDTAVKTGANILYTGVSSRGNFTETRYDGGDGHIPRQK